MKRTAAIALSAFALSGCVAGMAANAVALAAAGARGEPLDNQHLQPAAREACSTQAAPYGKVHIIDVEHRSASKLIVWGTVDDGTRRQSFECSFGTRITGFKIRPITRGQ
jgi:PBP1b-binding outer membrane lipoprotein LpoB